MQQQQLHGEEESGDPASGPLVVQSAGQALALVKGVSGAACPASATLGSTSTFSVLEPTGAQAPVYLEG